jgi:hypothetical protein
MTFKDFHVNMTINHGSNPPMVPWALSPYNNGYYPPPPIYHPAQPQAWHNNIDGSTETELHKKD